MGLEGVELVLTMEEEFGIEIPDEDVGRLESVGTLTAHICSKARTSGEGNCRTARTFYRLRRELMRVLSVTRDQIRLSTRVDDLVPAKRRRAVWQHCRDLGFSMPRLCLPSRIERALGILWLGVFLASVALPLGGLSVLPVLAALWLMGAVATSSQTRPLAVCLPRSVGTVRELALAATPIGPDAQIPGGLSYDDVAGRVRQILSRELDVPLEELRDDVEFVRDLKVD